MNRKFTLGLVLASACSLGIAAWAQAEPTPNPEPSAQEPKSKLSAADRKFMEGASQANLREITLGRMGVQRAQNDAVKTYAAMLVADHTKAEKSLKALAEKEGVKLPAKLDTSKTPLGRLEGATIEKFDAEYLDYAINVHEKDVATFEHQAHVDEANPELKRWVLQTLPMLEHHLSKAKELEKKLKLPEAPAMVP